MDPLKRQILDLKPEIIERHRHIHETLVCNGDFGRAAAACAYVRGWHGTPETHQRTWEATLHHMLSPRHAASYGDDCHVAIREAVGYDPADISQPAHEIRLAA